MSTAILTDLTLCIGCEACVWACKETHGLSRDDGGKELSTETWTSIDRVGDLSIRRQCMHCLDPACVSVCPVGALQKTAEGPVIYDEDLCMGCRYCMVGCPFGVPTYEWHETVPRVRKCIGCYDNAIKEGRQPACTAACPTGATIFGERDDLVAEAHRRIAEQPDRYVDHIYGLEEAGGTSVLYLSPVPFDQLGFPAGVRSDPYPKLTWNVLSKLPNVVSIAGVTLFGIHWITKRRNEVADAEKDPS